MIMGAYKRYQAIWHLYLTTNDPKVKKECEKCLKKVFKTLEDVRERLYDNSLQEK